MLCFRCEHRARFLEEGPCPRYECGQINQAVNGCYMYRPVVPVILKKRAGDPRPQFAGAMLAARSEYAGKAKGKYVVKSNKAGMLIYFQPEEDQ